jgi:hypothetical protein
VSPEIGGNLPLTLYNLCGFWGIQFASNSIALQSPKNHPFLLKVLFSRPKGRGKSTLVQGQLQHMSEKLIKFEDSMVKKWMLLNIPEHTIIFLHKIVFLKNK